MAQRRAIGPPPVSSARCSPVRLSSQRGDITQVYLPSKSRFCGRGMVVWFHGMPLVDRVAERVGLDERLACVPVVVVRAAEQDADAEVDVDQVGGDQLAVDDDAGRDVHRPAPVGHGLVGVVADLGVLERAPAAEQDAAPADLLVARQRLVEEVEQVVVQRHAPSS